MVSLVGHCVAFTSWHEQLVIWLFHSDITWPLSMWSG